MTNHIVPVILTIKARNAGEATSMAEIAAARLYTLFKADDIEQVHVLRAEKSAAATVHRYLDLSTSHLDLHTAARMEEGESLMEGDGEDVCYQQVTDPSDGELYAHIVAVLEPREDEARWPQCIRSALALARSLGCDYIRFDRDGQITNALPVYDWEGDAVHHPEETETVDDDTGKTIVRPRYIVRSGFAYWAMPHGWRPPVPGPVPPDHFLMRAPVLAGVVQWEDEEEVSDELTPPTYADMLHTLSPGD